MPLVEEGWTDHPVTTEVVRIYLSELLSEAEKAGHKPDTLVLGCTHYPLRQTIEAAVPATVRVIDSADAMADRVARTLDSNPGEAGSAGGRRFFATDSVEKFQNLGTRFLGSAIEEVRLAWIRRLTAPSVPAEVRQLVCSTFCRAFSGPAGTKERDASMLDLKGKTAVFSAGQQAQYRLGHGKNFRRPGHNWRFATRTTVCARKRRRCRASCGERRSFNRRLSRR